MIPPVPHPSLDTQLLTEERVAWIWNVSERTVRDWRQRGRLPYVKVGKNVVRYQPADVVKNILANYRLTQHVEVLGGEGSVDVAWQRIERLIETAIESRLAKRLEAA